MQRVLYWKFAGGEVVDANGRNRVKYLQLIAVLLCAATFTVPAADSSYSCSLHVGSYAAEQSTSKGESKGSGGHHTKTSVKTKTTNRSVSWPVSVLFTGKSLPAAGSVKLECHFIGTTDGRADFLGETTIPVELNEKGMFKTEVTSPTVRLVRKTTTTTRGGGRRDRRRGDRRVGRSTSVKSETMGSRVTGCIIQLMVNGKVEKSFASNSAWSKFAKMSPLPEAEILKIK